MSAAAWGRVVELWGHDGIDQHYGESVSLRDHMLQAAAVADDSGAPDPLVIAALLHDVGHLREPDVDPDQRNRDHAEMGHAALADVFPPDVTEPIRLHVAAKRHLVAREPAYRDELSAASIHTLRLQGGPLSEADQQDFLADPHHEAALRLRRWDEAAKDAGKLVPGLDHYQARIEALSGP